jgi:transcription elongation factor Elf1
MFKLTCTECQSQDFTVTYDHNRNLKLICSSCGKESEVKLELAQLTKAAPSVWPEFPGVTCKGGQITCGD